MAGIMYLPSTTLTRPNLLTGLSFLLRLDIQQFQGELQMKKVTLMPILILVGLLGTYYVFRILPENKQVVLSQNQTRLECLQKHEVNFTVSNENGKPVIRINKSDLEKLPKDCH